MNNKNMSKTWTDHAQSRILLAWGNPDQQDELGFAPLHRAIKADKPDPHVIAVLAKNGANIDVRDKRLRTPLHWAAQLGHREIVRLLLDLGADPAAKDIKGLSPAQRTRIPDIQTAIAQAESKKSQQYAAARPKPSEEKSKEPVEQNLLAEGDRLDGPEVRDDQNEQVQAPPEHHSSISELLDWPEQPSTPFDLPPLQAAAKSGKRANQVRSKARDMKRRHPTSSVASPVLNRKRRKAGIASAAVAILVISLGIFYLISNGSTLWAEVLSLSSSRATQSAGLVSGILLSNKKPCAIVDNQLVHEGDVIHRVRIVDIQKDRVVFERNGQTWVQHVHEKPNANWAAAIFTANPARK
jgi:hypothetical protein